MAASSNLPSSIARSASRKAGAGTGRVGTERTLELGDARRLVAIAQGTLRLFAIEVGYGLGQLLALEFLQTHRHGDGIVPVTQLLMNDQELCQSRLFEIAVITQLFPECFGPIEQAGSQKVTGQLLQGKLTLLTGQLTGDQVLVDLDGAIDLAPLTEQVAEGEVGFDGFAVDFQQLDKETALSDSSESK